jgi:hypothetical protein
MAGITYSPLILLTAFRLNCLSRLSRDTSALGTLAPLASAMTPLNVAVPTCAYITENEASRNQIPGMHRMIIALVEVFKDSRYILAPSVWFKKLIGPNYRGTTRYITGQG